MSGSFPDNQTSGDLIADRRFGYGQALLADKDYAAAADLFAQTLERVPEWSPGWFALGDAQELSGDMSAAILSFRKALALAPEDTLGAGLRLSRLGADTAGNAMTADYVAALFDQYADSFDDHLVKALDYRGPEIIMAALIAVCSEDKRGFRFSTVMDLGCGTGLMARAMAANADHIDGIDLSPAMVSTAQKTGLYRAVWVGDGADSLAHYASDYALVLAADVLVYIGDLLPLFKKVATCLEPDGLFAFTVQSHAGEGFILGPDLRYHHSKSALMAWAKDCGLDVLHVTPCTTRQDAGKPVPGLVVVMAKASQNHAV